MRVRGIGKEDCTKNRTTAGRVGVIGGGLGGLAAACTLASRGYHVVLFERNDWLGGKAAVLEADGFRFDMGPTILTMPSVLARIFAEAGRPVGDYLTLVRIDPQWRSFFADGTTLDLRADVDQMCAGVDALAPGTGAGYQRFMEQSARMHQVSDRFFFWRPVGGLRDMFSLKTAFEPSLLRDVLALNPGRSVAATVRSHVPDARVAQMLDHFTQYVGSAPDASPAVLCGIAHMQTGEGVWYPMGGTGAVPRALTRLATELGVEIRTGTGVRRILQANGGAVRGLETEAGELVPLDAVVSNADAVRTHRELLGGKAARRFERRRGYEPACSGVVLYLGLDRAYDQLLHHNFVFSDSPEEEFEAIYERGEPAPDPTCYVCAPARTEPGVARPGGDALYVLVHTPYLRPQHDWDRLFPAYRQTILDKLAGTAGMKDIADRIRVERWLTPADIHERYGVLNGAIYGIASHGRWLGAFKPSNRSPDVKGLYLAGGAAHPGPGMPMVLMSGWIAWPHGLAALVKVLARSCPVRSNYDRAGPHLGTLDNCQVHLLQLSLLSRNWSLIPSRTGTHRILLVRSHPVPRMLVCFAVVAAFAHACLAGQTSATSEMVIRLTVRPMPAPQPALRYQLLPALKDMSPGNPIQSYMKCMMEQKNFLFDAGGFSKTARRSC